MRLKVGCRLRAKKNVICNVEPTVIQWYKGQLAVVVEVREDIAALIDNDGYRTWFSCKPKWAYEYIGEWFRRENFIERFFAEKGFL